MGLIKLSDAVNETAQEPKTEETPSQMGIDCIEILKDICCTQHKILDLLLEHKHTPQSPESTEIAEVITLNERK